MSQFSGARLRSLHCPCSHWGTHQRAQLSRCGRLGGSLTRPTDQDKEQPGTVLCPALPGESAPVPVSLDLVLSACAKERPWHLPSLGPAGGPRHQPIWEPDCCKRVEPGCHLYRKSGPHVTFWPCPTHFGPWPASEPPWPSVAWVGADAPFAVRLH